MLGRIVRYSVDAAFISTFLAGIKRHTGYTPNTDPNAPNPIPLISGPNAHVYFQRYLSVGEYIFDTASGFAARSSHFRQTDPALNLAKGADDLIGKLRDQGASKGSQWFFGGKDKAN